jgi:hypothetical protein
MKTVKIAPGLSFYSPTMQVRKTERRKNNEGKALSIGVFVMFEREGISGERYKSANNSHS